MVDLDAADWSCFCSGEPEAMGRLYRRHKDALFTYCLHVTGQRATSEDIVQESFARLMLQKTRPVHIASIKNWLFICARNLAFDQHTRRKQESTLRDKTPDPISIPDPELSRFVHNVLGKLETDERELIILKEHQLFSTAELAEILGTTEGAIRVRLCRVRRKIQKLARELS